MKCDCPTCDDNATQVVVARQPFGPTVRVKACPSHLRESEDGVRAMLEAKGFQITVEAPLPS